ncbi:MAG: glucosyltransferase domain-containing protein [Clostridia bacterium]
MNNKRNIKHFIQNNKIDICVLIAMISFAFIICVNFLKPHFPLDAYYISAYGYSHYIPTFLASNRMFCALLFKLWTVLDISLNTEMIIMGIVLTFVMAISWFILYKCVMKLTKKENSIFYNILIAAASFLVVFNFCTAEGLLFIEDATMPIGVFCSILGACILVTDKKIRYIISLILITIASVLYQGTIGIFVLLALVLIAIKNKGNIKLIVKDTIIIGLIYCFAMIFNFIGVKIWSHILNIQFREFTFPSISTIIHTIIEFGKILLINNCGIGPKYWYLTTLLIMSTIFIANIIIKKKDYFEILEYFVLITLSILIPIIPTIVTPVGSQYLEPRMAMCFGSSIGILIIFLVSVSRIDKNKILLFILTIISILSFIGNSIYMIVASTATLNVNKIEKIIAEQIINEIQEYEEQTQNEIKAIGIAFDKNPTRYYNKEPQLISFNIRGFGTIWAVKEIITTYSGKEYKDTIVPENIKEDFLEKDWDTYNKEQLVFDGENLYICIF